MLYKYFLSKVKTFRRAASWENKMISRPDCLGPFCHSQGQRLLSFYGGAKRSPIVLVVFWQGPDYISASNFTGFSMHMQSGDCPKEIFKKWNLNVKEIL